MESDLAYQEAALEELLGGRVVLISPRPSLHHSFVTSNIYTIFDAYLRGKRCTPLADGVDLYLTETDRFIPDGMIVCDPEKLQPNGVHGAPDLVVEVLSPGTAKNDRGYKKDVYERCGVREYWIADPVHKSVEQYLLRDGKFVLHEVYLIPPAYLFEKMKPEERAAIPTEFRCSLYDDLIIRLEDVFRRLP